MTFEISVTEARAEFSELINRVGYGGERIILTRHGKPLVALVPAADAIAVVEDGGAVTLLDLAAHRDAGEPSRRIAAHHPLDPQAQ